MRKQFMGVWPALITPFTAENQINETVLREIVNYHIEKGVAGFYVGGTTGEGIFMSVPERKRVMEIVLGEIAGRVPVIVHVGSVALQDVLDQARNRGFGSDKMSQNMVYGPVGPFSVNLLIPIISLDVLEKVARSATRGNQFINKLFAFGIGSWSVGAGRFRSHNFHLYIYLYLYL